jgi:2-amino-4-hydroxy-6-hydroxymethyldihydropteridine diphosphokinase
VNLLKRLIIALGTNIGDREVNLACARSCLAKIWRNETYSNIYETVPWGGIKQPLFLNQVGIGETDRSPLTVLAELKAFEQELGREPGPRYGPRTIDLDILYYDDWIITSELLCIPHARLHERAFVLIPLAELVPDFTHPCLGLSQKQLLNKLSNPQETCWKYLQPTK